MLLAVDLVLQVNYGATVLSSWHRKRFRFQIHRSWEEHISADNVLRRSTCRIMQQTVVLVVVWCPFSHWRQLTMRAVYFCRGEYHTLLSRRIKMSGRTSRSKHMGLKRMWDIWAEHVCGETKVWSCFHCQERRLPVVPRCMLWAFIDKIADLIGCLCVIVRSSELHKDLDLNILVFYNILLITFVCFICIATKRPI